MPQPITKIEHALAIAVAKNVAVFVEIGQIRDLTTEAPVVWMRDVAGGTGEFQLAKTLAERRLLFVRNVLVVKDEDAIVVQCLAYDDKVLIRQRCRDREASDLRDKLRSYGCLLYTLRAHET